MRKTRLKKWLMLRMMLWGKLGGTLLEGIVLKSKRVKGQLGWLPLGRRCNKKRKEGQYSLLV